MAELAYNDAHTTTQDTSLIRHVQQLVVLEMLVAAAYQGVHELVDDPALRARLRRFGLDHERSADRLIACLHALGVRTTGDPLSSHTDNEGVVGGLTPLMAMWLNEDEAAKAYEELIERASDQPLLGRALERGLDEAREHWEWLTVEVHPQLSPCCA